MDWNLGQGENRGALRVEEQQHTRMHGGERWIPKNRKHRTIPFTVRGREILERLYASTSLKADELVIPNTHGLPYMRLDEGPMKGGSAGIWNRLREVSGVQGVAMRDLRHYAERRIMPTRTRVWHAAPSKNSPQAALPDAA